LQSLIVIIFAALDPLSIINICEKNGQQMFDIQLTIIFEATNS